MMAHHLDPLQDTLESASARVSAMLEVMGDAQYWGLEKDIPYLKDLIDEALRQVKGHKDHLNGK